MRRGAMLMLILVALLSLVVVAPSTSQAAIYTGPDRVFFPQTGQYLSLGFLTYWQDNGGVTTFGYPITGEIQQNGITTQYFERAVFEYHADQPDGQRIQLRRLGAEQAQQLSAKMAADQSKAADIASRIGLPPPDNTNPFAPAEKGQDTVDYTFFDATQHSIINRFRSFWGMHGGLATFGYPLSEEFTDPTSHLIVQYFERAIFEWHPDDANGNEVQPRLLGIDAAHADGVNMAPVQASSETPVYNAGLWKVTEPANPRDLTTPLPGAPTGFSKWIEVDLSQQYMRAWQDNKVVYQEYVSTGIPDHATPTGYYQIFWKLVKDDMTNGPTADPAEYYNLKDVPWVMYFLQGGYALHGTYWHHNFGHVMSHGCVNMTTSGAKWVYQWAPPGTMVWIHQ
jgi:lipoprotein-anchoring transpeptidase ErfK/SrfK